MKSNSAFDFTVDREKKTLNVKREFAADISTVWDAYTKSEILDKWWAPKPWKARTKSMDFSKGGSWFYAMVGPEGEEHWCRVDYTSIEPNKSFSGLDAFTDPEGNLKKDMPQSKWDVTFTQNGDVTLVECNITFADLAQLDTILQMGMKEGLALAMEGLDELLATSKKTAQTQK